MGGVDRALALTLASTRVAVLGLEVAEPREMPAPVVQRGQNNIYLQPLKPGESISISDGRVEFIGSFESEDECQGVALNNTEYFSFVYFSAQYDKDKGFRKMCYARTDRGFFPYAEDEVVSGHKVPACTSDIDCELNGKCDVARKECSCEPGWKGFSCGELDLLPAKLENGYNRPGYSSWGGSVVQDPKTKVFHMFAAEMDGHCGINLWFPNSQCIRATSPKAEGPYTFEEVVVPQFCHEPVVVTDPSASSPARGETTYRLFHVGPGVQVPGKPNAPMHVCNAYDPPNGTTDCTQAECADTAWIGGKTRDKLQVLSSTSLVGPWATTDLPETQWQMDTNPAPYIAPNGSVILLNRVYDNLGMRIVVATAPRFDGPYDMDTGPVATQCEDPHLWRSASGSFHALFHHNNYKAWPLAQGTHAYSRDGLRWTYSSTFAYTGVVAMEDGSTVVWNRRERPHLLQGADGRATHLITGVGNAVDGWTPGQDATHTHVQAIRNPSRGGV